MGFFSIFKKSLGIPGVSYKPKDMIRVLNPKNMLKMVPGQKQALGFATGGASSFMDAFKKNKGARPAAAPAAAPVPASQNIALRKWRLRTKRGETQRSYAANKKVAQKAAAQRTVQRQENRAYNADVAKAGAEGWGGGMAKIIADMRARRR